MYDEHKHHSEKLVLKMTPEESQYYPPLLSFIETNLNGSLKGKRAAEFLKKSGLPKAILKKIWLTASPFDTESISKEDFFIALRLIALAQNNMDYSLDSIKLNNPIPPLPKFNEDNSNKKDLMYSTAQNSYNNNQMSSFNTKSTNNIPSSLTE